MKTVYIVGSYPGMVVNPFYVTMDGPTTDGQAILDVLADSLAAQGISYVFDDAEEYPDEMITVAGNECHRFIHGGCLSIRELELSDMTAIFREKCGTDNVLGWVDVVYATDEWPRNEVSFCAENAEELAKWWLEFCKEKDLSPYDALSVAKIRYFRKNYHTERGTIYVLGAATEDIAYKAGFSYSFYSEELRTDVFSKCLDDRGLRHQFLLIEKE